MLVEKHAQQALSALAEVVERRFDDDVLAKLWAAEQIRRAMDSQISALLSEARGSHRQRPRRKGYTWEELGGVLGMSPQGARQRSLRRRTPMDPPVKAETLVPDHPSP